MTTAHVYSYSEIIEMCPYERDAFLSMIINDEQAKRRHQSSYDSNEGFNNNYQRGYL